MLVSAGTARRPLIVALVLTLVVGLTGLVASPAQALAEPPLPPDTPLPDPIPANPVLSGLTVTVQEVAAFPKSEPTPPPTDVRLMRHARINYIGQVPDRSGRLYVPDLNGTLYLVKNGVPQPYLDLAAQFAPDFFSGRGLGSGFGFVAFHPEFARNGRFYTIHTETGAALGKTPDLPPQDGAQIHGVLTEWAATNPAADTFSGTRREVMRLAFRSFIHGFQEIGFNPTARPSSPDYGQLYIAVGDGGRGVASPDPQNLAMPHGKILRISPRATGAGAKWGIPPLNPFVGRPGALGEIYAYGLRNPHRFSWDPAAPHRMYVGMIGEQNIESIYEVQPGDNFGWTEREGPFVVKENDPTCLVYTLPADDARFGYTYPVVAYDHDRPAGFPPCRDSGDAVIGGFVYRGSLPILRGKYVFGDDVNGRLFYTNAWQMRRGRGLAPIFELMIFNTTGERVTMQQLAGDARVDLRFGRDARGELYLLSKANGKIWKIVGARKFANCNVGTTRVDDAMAASNWSPVTPSKWQFPGTEVILAEAGTARPGPRRPFEYAVLTKGPAVKSVRINGTVRLDTPVSVTNRDVIIVFGHRSDTEFYYAHLSSDNTIYPHNGIFVVNNADRVRIEHQWNGVIGAPPAVRDEAWHDVEVVHCATTGEIAVYVDGEDLPRMTAIDKTFNSGRVGFGSFDNIGRLRDLRVTGTPLTE